MALEVVIGFSCGWRLGFFAFRMVLGLFGFWVAILEFSDTVYIGDRFCVGFCARLSWLLIWGKLLWFFSLELLGLVIVLCCCLCGLPLALGLLPNTTWVEFLFFLLFIWWFRTIFSGTGTGSWGSSFHSPTQLGSSFLWFNAFRGDLLFSEDLDFFSTNTTWCFFWLGSGSILAAFFFFLFLLLGGPAHT